MAQIMDPLILANEVEGDALSIIGGPIVDDRALPIGMGLRQKAFDSLAEETSLVVARNNDADRTRSSPTHAKRLGYGMVGSGHKEAKHFSVILTEHVFLQVPYQASENSKGFYFKPFISSDGSLGF